MLVVITIIGFIVLDIAYTAVVINYCIQCQLLVYLIRSICERIKTKDWEIDQSIKVWKGGREEGRERGRGGEEGGREGGREGGGRGRGRGRQRERERVRSRAANIF